MAISPVTLGGYWISDYTKSATCNESQLSYCDDIVNGFMAGMQARGHKYKVLRRDGEASPRHWASGTDGGPHGADTVDFAFLATHGNTFGVEPSGKPWVHWVNAAFASADGCLVSTVKHPVNRQQPVAGVKLGGGSLRWAVWDLCRSLQVGLENDTKVIKEDPDHAHVLQHAKAGLTWQRCFTGVNMIFGFTGLSSDSDWTRYRGLNFGLRAGHGDGLAESWLDEARSYWADDAPVALACGKDGEDARRRLKADSLKAPEPSLSPSDIGSFYCLWRS